MHAAQSSFSAISTELDELQLRRERIIDDAFDALSGRRPDMASLLVEGLGSRRKAALWLSTRQRTLAGRTAWQLLGEGDEDTVWDAVGRLAYGKAEGYDTLSTAGLT